jgi:hypothetical protein
MARNTRLSYRQLEETKSMGVLTQAFIWRILVNSKRFYTKFYRRIACSLNPFSKITRAVVKMGENRSGADPGSGERGRRALHIKIHGRFQILFANGGAGVPRLNTNVHIPY